MTAEAFCDTNIWVYAASSDVREAKKKKRSLEIIHSQIVGVSTQVLQEFYVTVTRKIAVPMAPFEALQWIESMEAFPLVAVDGDIVKVGIGNSITHQISYWDGAIIAATEQLGCPILYSEDLNALQQYGSVQVVNPYADLES